MSAQDRSINAPVELLPKASRAGNQPGTEVSGTETFSEKPGGPTLSIPPVHTLSEPCSSTLSLQAVHSEKKMDTVSTWAVQGQQMDRVHGQRLDTVDEQGSYRSEPSPALILSPRPIRTMEQQEKVLTFFREAGHCVTQLKLISNTLHIPYGTVRHIIRRLNSLGVLKVKPYCGQGVQGIEVQYVKAADTFPKNSPSDTLSSPSCPQDTSSGQSTWTPSGQPLHLKKDREKDLSIWTVSIEDIETLWPAVRAAGLFPGHIQKVREAFIQQGWPQEKAEVIVAQTLRYLDWQLEHGGILDQHGKKVENPIAYWLCSLQRHGYYQQPKGYVDPRVRALQQIEDEEKARLAAKQRIQDLKMEQEKLAQDEEIERTLQALAQEGKAHPLWEQVYTLLPGMLRQKIDSSGSNVLATPMVAGVIRSELKKLYGFHPTTKASCPKADMPASSPSTVC